jgi:hypothetical protein
MVDGTNVRIWRLGDMVACRCEDAAEMGGESSARAPGIDWSSDGIMMTCSE